ncbi:MAG: hypothetical protein AB7G13_15320 [Lautropia sp.]
MAQLARSLAPHTVLIHHDFSQTADFVIDEPNVVFVADPKRTGWAVWGFVDGLFHGMRYALRHLEFDYLQVLSPTCLPIKPIADFERHVMAGGIEAHYAAVDVLNDPDAYMTIGFRAFAPQGTLRYKLLMRMTWLYFGGVNLLNDHDSSQQRRDVGNVQLRTGGETTASGRLRLRARFARGIMRLAERYGRHGFSSDLPPFYGSTWFGARRHVIAWMVDRFAQPDIQRYFPDKHIADEFLVPTLLKRGGFRSGTVNHCIVTFVEANPTWLSDADFDKLRASPAHFARKFPDDSTAPIRHRVLRDLALRADRSAGAAVDAVAVS